MATEITYGGYSFPHPYPFVGMDENPVFISGVIDHGIIELSLVGELTGCDLTSLKRQKDDLVEALGSGFQTLTVGNTGYSYAQPKSVQFASSQIRRRMPYQIDFTIQHEKDFSKFYGVQNPVDTWQFSETDNRVSTATHVVSAKGVKTTADSLGAARDFVNSRLNGFQNNSLMLTGDSAILTSKQESVDRVNNSYSVTESWKYSLSRNEYDKEDAIVRANSKIVYSEDGTLSVTVDGTIEGGISGSADTGFFTANDATEFAKNALANSKASFEDALYGHIFQEPKTFSYDENTGSNTVNFSFNFGDATDTRDDSVVHDYSTTVEASKDKTAIGIKVDGEVRYNLTDNPNTGEAPELEVRYQLIDDFFSGVDQFAIAAETFEWFSGANLEYGDTSLNDLSINSSVTKDPYNSRIDYSYTYSNGVDFFSGYLRNPRVTVTTEHPLLKYGIKPSTDNSFAVQGLYTTLERKSVSIEGYAPETVGLQDAIDFVSGFAEQYAEPNGYLVSDSIETGNRAISMSKTFILE